MITQQKLDEIEERLVKGWVIRRDQIEALVTFCRSHPALVGPPGPGSGPLPDDAKGYATATSQGHSRP